MNLETRYREACRRADEARGRLTESAAITKARIAPARIKQDMKDKATDAVLNGVTQAVAKVQERPVATGAAVAAVGLFLARRPLTALFRRLYVRLYDAQLTKSETDDG